MKLRDIVAAVRDHPELRQELAEARSALADSQAECVRLEKQCAEWNAAGLGQQYELNCLQKKARALQAALDSLCPKLETTEQLRQFYGAVSPSADPDGFKLYFAAQKVTGIRRLYDHFPYEDARGLFEEMNGHALLHYLTAVHFGALEWDIVPGTTYESATIREVDQTTPEYLAFEKKLYAQALKDLGFQSLLPPGPNHTAEQTRKKTERSDYNGR